MLYFSSLQSDKLNLRGQHMDAQVFWDVIGNYNRQTWIIQIALLIFLLIAVALSYTKKIKWAAKFSLGIINLFIGIGFFAWYGTEPIQKFLHFRCISLAVFCSYTKVCITRTIYSKHLPHFRCFYWCFI